MDEAWKLITLIADKISFVPFDKKMRQNQKRTKKLDEKSTFEPVQKKNREEKNTSKEQTKVKRNKRVIYVENKKKREKMKNKKTARENI